MINTNDDEEQNNSFQMNLVRVSIRPMDGMSILHESQAWRHSAKAAVS